MPASEVQRLGYSPGEFAEAFGITRTHAHNLIKRGEIATITLGRRRIIPAAVVQNLLSTAAPEGGVPRDAA